MASDHASARKRTIYALAQSLWRRATNSSRDVRCCTGACKHTNYTWSRHRTTEQWTAISFDTFGKTQGVDGRVKEPKPEAI